MWNAAAEPFVRVLIGKAAEGRSGRYVRAVSEVQTWLIDTSPEPVTSPADWLERKLLDVDFARVASVSRALGGVPEFSAARSAGGDTPLAVAALPAGKAPRYQSVFDAAARVILTAQPEDVRKAGELDFAGAAETVIGCFDGLSLTVRALEAQDGNWVTLGCRGGNAGGTRGRARDGTGARRGTRAGASRRRCETGRRGGGGRASESSPRRLGLQGVGLRPRRARQGPCGLRAGREAASRGGGRAGAADRRRTKHGSAR